MDIAFSLDSRKAKGRKAMTDTRLLRMSERRPRQALEALDRITGIRWRGLPCSLLAQVRAAQSQRKAEREADLENFARQQAS